VLLIIVSAGLFFWAERVLLTRLAAGRDFEKGMRYAEKARALPRDVLVKRSVLYQGVLKSLQRSRALNPADARVYFESGEVLAEIMPDKELRDSIVAGDFGIQGNTEEAFYASVKKYYIEAVRRQPTNAVYHQRLGQIYDVLSDTRRAEEEFDKALYLDPLNLSIHIFLSKYYLSKHNEEKFNVHLARTIQLYQKTGLAEGGGPLHNMMVSFLRSIEKEELIAK